MERNYHALIAKGDKLQNIVRSQDNNSYVLVVGFLAQHF